MFGIRNTSERFIGINVQEGRINNIISMTSATLVMLYAVYVVVESFIDKPRNMLQ